LLCLGDAEPFDALPGLELLQHEITRSPLSITPASPAAERFDLALIDGTRDVRRARQRCLELREFRIPRVLIIAEPSLPAVTPEWAVTDLLLPHASPSEVDARLRLAKAASPAGAADSAHDELGAAGIVINEANFTAHLHNRTLDLTYKEFELLHFLTANSGRVFTREQLLAEVWGSDYFGGTRTVDVHVRRLRAKLGENESLISTVRGVGYGFARPQSTDEHETGAGPDSTGSQEGSSA